jgi:putative flippase GtrA
MTASPARHALSVGLPRPPFSFGLYAAFRTVSSAAAANVMALVITAMANSATNCRLTFEVRGDGLSRHQAAAPLALVLALAVTSGSLGILDVVAPHRGRLTEIVVLLAANAAATLVRFLLLRLVIDRARSDRPPAERVRALATLSTSERARG